MQTKLWELLLRSGCFEVAQDVLEAFALVSVRQRVAQRTSDALVAV